MKRKPSILLWTCALLPLVSPGLSLAKTYTRQFDVANEQRHDERIPGPVILDIRNLNALRYDIRIGVRLTYTPGPALPPPFVIPAQAAPISKGQAQAARQPLDEGIVKLKARATGDIKSKLDLIAALLDMIERDRLATESDIADVSASTREANGKID